MKTIENFFNMPFDQAVKEKKEFNLFSASEAMALGLNLEAIVCFNLAKLGYREGTEQYREAKKEEMNYLGGTW